MRPEIFFFSPVQDKPTIRMRTPKDKSWLDRSVEKPSSGTDDGGLWDERE